MRHAGACAVAALTVLVASSRAADEPALPGGARARLGSTNLRQCGTGHQVAWSPDGKWLASASSRSLVLWDPVTGKALSRHHARNVAAITVAPDGNTIVLAENTEANGRVRAKDGSFVTRWAARGHCLGAAFSPSGHAVAVVTDGRVLVLDPKTGAELRRLELRGTEYGGVVWSKDGKRLLAAADRRLVSWLTESWLETTHDVKARVQSIALSTDGKWLALTEPAGMRILDACSFAHVAREVRDGPEKESATRRIAFSPDGTLVATSLDGELTLAAPGGMTGARRIGTHSADTIDSLAFSPDGRRLAVGRGTAIELVDVASGRRVLADDGHEAPPEALAFTRDGQLVSLAQDRSLRVWDVAHATVVRTIAAPGAPTSFSLGGARVAFVEARRAVVHDLAKGTVLASLTAAEAANVRAVALAPDGATAAIAAESSVELHRVDGAKREASLDLDVTVTALAFSPDGRVLAAGHADGVRLIDPAARAAGAALETRGLEGLVFSPDGKRLALAKPGRTELWDVVAAKLVHTLTTRESSDSLEGGLGVAWSPDGKRIATLHGGRRIHVWDAASGKLVRSIEWTESDAGWATSVAFSTDGKTLAAGIADGPILLFSPPP